MKGSLEDFAGRLQQLADESDTAIDINEFLEAEAVLIGGLLDSDMYPIIGELWENEFLRIIDESAPSFSAIAVAPVVSNSLRQSCPSGLILKNRAGNYYVKLMRN